MATAYSSEVAVGSNIVRLKVDYSGTDATCTIQVRRNSAWTDYWADSNASITFNGTTKSTPYSYSGTIGTSFMDLCSSSGFSVSTSGGSYNWTFSNPSGGVLGCSGTITIPSQGSAPSGGYITTVVRGTNSFTFTGGITSWGNPNSGRMEFVVLKSAYTTGGIPQYYTQLPQDTMSGTATVDNNSSTSGSPAWTIQPNTKYYVGIYASNGSADYRYDGGQYTTLAAAATVSTGTVTSSSIVINYSTAADGGEYSKSIQYSLDGTTWVTGATVSTGSVSSGSFTISGLTPGTSYSIQTRTSTAAGNSVGATLSVTTSAIAPTGGSITNISTTADSITATVAISSWGGSTTSAHKELTVHVPPDTVATAGLPHRYTGDDTTNLSGTFTVDNNSSTVGTPVFNISPNTSYNLGVYAKNNAGELRYVYPSNPVTTKAAAATVSAGTPSGTSVAISYSTAADGGVYDKEIQYSLDGTTWTTGATVTGGAAASGSFTITLPVGPNSVQTRVHTTAGDTAGATLTIVIAAPSKIYVPVEVSGSIVRKEASKIYVPVEVSGTIVRKAVSKVYVPVYDSTSQTYKRKSAFEA